MRTHLIRDLLQHLDRDGSLKVDHCSAEEKRRLDELPLPVEVKQVLQFYWPNNGGKVGGYDLYTVKEILANDDLPRLLAAEMLAIGFARNGDPLVLHFTGDSCAVGLISHDELWGEAGDPKEIYLEVTGSIEDFLWRAAEGRYLPVDYYAVAELLEMQRESEGR